MAAERVRLLVKRAARFPAVLIGFCLAAVALGLGALRERSRRRRSGQARARDAEVVAVPTPNQTSKGASAKPGQETTAHPARAEPSAAPAPGAGARGGSEEQDRASTAKLDLGPAARDERPVEHIPWSYGQDRLTAAAVDPDRLYAYWELTDDAIARAREGLGLGGRESWLNLRVYDTSGLIFDGTNAHVYFDHRVERWDRQWFFQIGKPSSTAHVEIGVKSAEGFFVKIARSSRVDFPRSEPAPRSEPEWMTVLPVTGEVRRAGVGLPSAGPRNGAPAPREEAGARAEPFTPIPLWVLRQPADGREADLHQIMGAAWERVVWQEGEGERFFELAGRAEWQGPMLATTWEAGPFTYPVEVQPPTRQELRGGSLVYRVGGVTHVAYGPWQVVIRHLGAHHGRSLLSRWVVYRSWVAEGGYELSETASSGRGAAARPGASERVAPGASERLWLSGSELRLGGASEVWRMGASELRFGGASETLFAGASQWMFRGASERRFAGASETLLRGASERRLGGASERLGASERRLGGASEQLGASERRLGGASEQLGAGEPHRQPDESGFEGGTYPEVE